MRPWIAALLALSLLLLSACGSKPAEKPADKSAPSQQQTQPAEPVKLRFVSLAWQKQSVEANKEIVATWNKEHPNIQVEYVQGDWNSIHDYMLTSFESGDVPDIFHYESPLIIDWINRGYLADLTDLIPEEMQKDILPSAWDTVRHTDGKIYAVPFLWEAMVTLYNAKAFKEANITPPTIENPWTWADMMAAAKKLTKDTNGDGTPDQYGAAWGLKAPVNRILNLALNFNGKFFYEENGKTVVKMGQAEKQVLKNINDMMYVDKSASTDGIGQSGTALLPGFYAGKYAMLPGIGVWARQQIIEQAPPGFEWGVLPPLKGETQNQGTVTQTLSIPAKSKHQKEAMQFISYFLNTANMGRLAQGDWLFPTRKSSMNLPEFQTEKNGWKISSEYSKYLTLAPFQKIPGFAEWKSKVATPILQEYFGGKLSLDEAAKRIEAEGNPILERYAKK